LKYFHSFAEIKDGISGLTDREIILKANETPQKLKDSFSVLMKKLEKNKIELDKGGKINYKTIPKPALNFVKKNERLITVCLLCKDLDFEIPHKASKTEIKNQIMKEITDEELRLEGIQTSAKESEAMEREKSLTKRINYENYFQINPNYGADVIVTKANKMDEARGNIKKLYTYDEFVKEFAKKFMFDNDLLYETYYYWETLIEKEERLRQLWLNSRKNMIDINDREKNKKIYKLNEEILDLIRGLRRKIDQTLIKNKKHPVFGANYRYYNYEDFMVDSDVEFHKIKKFLENDSVTIQKDPEIGLRYKELIDLLKRKKIQENTTPAFGNEKENNYFRGESLQEEKEDEEGTEIYVHLLEGMKTFLTQPGEMAYESELNKKADINQADEETDNVKKKLVSQFEEYMKNSGLTTQTKKTNTPKSGKKAIKGVKSKASGKELPKKK
jgi:hypothetical protein